jgi:hypothetical protein
MDSLARTLPASWFCSPALYQVERRAVFLKVDPTTSVLWQSNTNQSWHLLGPVTRFQSRSKPVIYEIAQVTLVVENKSPESVEVDCDGIVVHAQDEVSSSPRFLLTTLR